MSPFPVQVERAAAFGLLGLLWTLAYPRHFVASAVAVLIVAVALEIAQELRPGRHGRDLDALVKLGGAAVGLGFGALIRRSAKNPSGR